MAKKILVILGSPRLNGNSATLAGQIANGAISGAAEVETVYLHGRNEDEVHQGMEEPENNER